MKKTHNTFSLIFFIVCLVFGMYVLKTDPTHDVTRTEISSRQTTDHHT